MTDLERMLIEHACERLIMLYALHADTYAPDAVAGLFTDDAVLNRGDGDAVGRAAILAAFNRRRPDAAVRHISTNVVIDVDSEDSARGVSTMTLYRRFGTMDLPQPLEPAEMIADYHDTFRRTPDGWRFAHRRAVRVFERDLD
ncbi:MAG: nuclear transport factor 2 family protein [Alphaproteobacteria bacterium]|nr:nuclear transport factor 2 family protein [Alphaproteobacteria bacterium]